MLNSSQSFCLKLAIAATCLAPITANAQILIHGSTDAYTETGGDWLTMGANDIDGDGGRGTDGYLFFGNFDGFGLGAQNYADGTPAGNRSLPTYVTSDGPGADFVSIADEFGYGEIDNPNFVGAANEGDDTESGIAVGTSDASGNSDAGTFLELVTFDIFGLETGQTVRIGVLGGNEDSGDGQFDSTSITLSDGTNFATVGDDATSPLAINPGGVETGWVFFDVSTDGTYAVGGTRRLDTGGASIGGLTFDSVIVAVPEPSSYVILGLGMIGLATRRRR